ncbi:MAG: hypothetical protein ACIARQ_09990 [Phycisphaerales bacterium JB061]
MQGKYPNWFAYQAARLKRMPMVSQLRDLVSWEPMTAPEEGYTVVIGCMAALPDVAVTNLNLMRRMQMPSAKQVILVFDRPAEQMPEGLVERIEEARGDMPVTILNYSEKQHAVAERIKWGWVYAWMSWSIGIGASKTRHVLLHDLDAMPVNPKFFERRYELARDSGKAFFGIRWYKGNGILPTDELTTTFEMVLDAQVMREKTKPIHGFNTIRKLGGRACDFDTFLYSQLIVGSSGQAPIDEGDMVHPSQMICQYTDMIAGRNTAPMPKTNLPLMPVYMHLGGHSEPLEHITSHLKETGDARLPFMGKSLDVSKMTSVHWVWLEAEARKLGVAAAGEVSQELDTYLGLLRDRVEANGV